MIKNKNALVIFDWDGTLIDSVGRIVSSMQAAAAFAELTIPSDKQVRGIIGLSLPAVYEILFKGAHEAQLEKLKMEYRRQFVEVDHTPALLFSGAREVLEALRGQGYRLAVATGKARYGLERAWNEVDAGHFFEVSRCSDEAEGKPHPQMVLDLLTMTQTPAERAIVVGDTSWDMLMAKQAHVDRVGVSYGAHEVEELIPHEPLKIIDDIAHLPEIIKQHLS